MRTILSASALLVAVVLVPLPATAEQPSCPPNPLTQAHEPWMKMSTGAVDFQMSPPASATNPLMQNIGRPLPAAGPAAEAGPAEGNPLTHRP